MFPLDLISQDPVLEFSNAYRHLVHVFSYLEPVSDSLVPVFLYLYSATALGADILGCWWTSYLSSRLFLDALELSFEFVLRGDASVTDLEFVATGGRVKPLSAV